MVFPPALMVVVTTSLAPSHTAFDTCAVGSPPPRPATIFLLSEPSRLKTVVTVWSPCMRVIVSVCAFCAIVNSLPKPPPPRPPPRPPPPPPPPPPAGAAAASATHLPEKSGLACAARLAATPNISTTAMRRKFRRISLTPVDNRYGGKPPRLPEAGLYPSQLAETLRKH